MMVLRRRRQGSAPSPILPYGQTGLNIARTYATWGMTPAERAAWATTPAGRAALAAGGALDLYGALDPNRSVGSRITSGLGAGNAAYGLYNNTAGVPYAGSALAAAGLGLNLAQIAGSDYSTKRKIGQGASAAVDTGISLIPVIGQFYALARALSGVGQRLQRSGSPEVRGVGRGLQYTVEPGFVGAGRDLIFGQRSLPAALKAAGGSRAVVTDFALGPLSGLARGLGIYRGLGWAGPTSRGGEFRQNLGKVFDRFGLPININFQDRSAYEGKDFSGIDEGARNDALTWSNEIAQGMGKPDYQNQVYNILLNNYGGDVTKYRQQFLAQREQAAAANTNPAAAGLTARTAGAQNG